MKITLERFGGVTGVRPKPLVIDTAALASSEAAQLEALATHALAGRARPRAAARPDAFTYELTIEDADASRAIPFDFEQADDALKALVSAVRAQVKRPPG
jgi:hypothetical protein